MKTSWPKPYIDRDAPNQTRVRLQLSQAAIASRATNA